MGLLVSHTLLTSVHNNTTHNPKHRSTNQRECCYHGNKKMWQKSLWVTPSPIKHCKWRVTQSRLCSHDHLRTINIYFTINLKSIIVIPVIIQWIYTDDSSIFHTNNQKQLVTRRGSSERTLPVWSRTIKLESDRCWRWTTFGCNLFCQEASFIQSGSY